MCTIVIVNHHYKGFPLVIAANRDEEVDRPSSDVQILSREPHLIVGGKDDLKGGTWLGVNKQSIFAAITNQGDKDKLLSRGQLVLDALKCKTLEELLSFVEEINPAKYNKFNLVFGNNKSVYIAYSYLLHSMVIRELPKGIHVVSDDMKFAGETPKGSYVHKKLDIVNPDKPWLDYYKILKKTLANIGSGIKINPTRKEGKLYGYCTKSSSILAFDEEGLARYKFHDRLEPRAKKKDRKEGKPYIPRYKDYIDLWRNPDNLPGVSLSSSEENETDDKEEEMSPKEAIMHKFLLQKLRRI
jgi:hypothetical protein